MRENVLYTIRKNKKELGFINNEGEVVIKPQFQNDQRYTYHLGAVDFSNPVPVKLKGKWGYIDVKGDFLISPVFDLAYRFSEGLAVVGRVYELPGSLMDFHLISMDILISKVIW